MKYIHRNIEPIIKQYLELFPAIGLTGPRQSGKSTTLKECLCPEYQYNSFDDPIICENFYNDPYAFMKKYSNKVIFDEAQKIPEIFNYVKIQIDNDRNSYGKYILTGSSQFSLLKQITESLAGRIGLLSLLPFQLHEMPSTYRSDQMLKGSYPELVLRAYKGSSQWYNSYIENYLQKDVRSLHNIGNLRDFQRFMLLLAGRVSQELNMSTLSRELGISVNTIKSWLSILEASYIIFLLPSYHKNFGKKIIKRPKLYFYDTGLICFLANITDSQMLNNGILAGPIFENYVIAEIQKAIIHTGLKNELYFFRTNYGLEIDIIWIDNTKREIQFIEIKNNSTPKSSMLKNIKTLMSLEKEDKLFNTYKKKGLLLYKGSEQGSFAEDLEYYNYIDFLKTFNKP
jgi:hypothetical protein